jgi:hypothetical protein
MCMCVWGGGVVVVEKNCAPLQFYNESENFYFEISKWIHQKNQKRKEITKKTWKIDNHK